MNRNLSMAEHLRMKYRPRMRMGVGIVSLAPWLDVVLAGGLFWAVARMLTVAPGLVLDLPGAPFEAGLSARHALLVFAARPGGESGDRVFFLDEHFDLAIPGRRDALVAALSGVGSGPRAGITIFADQAVRHGTVAYLLGAARAAGITRVNLATGIPHADTLVLDGIGERP